MPNEPVGPSALDKLPVVLKTWVLLESDSISEPIECPFDIDLSELDLRDTFAGEHLSLRHVLSYRVVRPWYTFSVRGEEAIAIKNCATEMPPPPEKKSLRARSSSPEKNESAQAHGRGGPGV